MLRKNIHVFQLFPLIVFLFILSGNVLAVQLIQHHDPAFELSLPDNFKPLPETLMPEGWLYGFKERTGLRDEPQISIGIEKTSGEIKHRQKRLEMLKKKFSYPQASISTKNFYATSGQIQGIEVINTAGKVKSIMLIAELPAKGGFIQIIAGGNTQREQEIRQIFSGILLSFIAKDDHLNMDTKITALSFLFLTILSIYFFKNKFISKKK